MGFVLGFIAGLVGGFAALIGILAWGERWARRHPLNLKALLPMPEWKPGEDITLDEADVPEELRGALPVVRKWGLPDDVAKDKIDAAPAEAREELVRVMREHYWTIQKWIDGVRTTAMPEWLVFFMYARDAAEMVVSDLAPARPRTGSESR